MFESVELPNGTPLRLPRVVPLLSDSETKTRWVGPRLGAHNDEIYGDLLGMGSTERRSLHERGVI